MGARAKRVSSPAATGGAGQTFEQHIGALWLSLLLARAIPPIFTDTVVTEVLFQTESLGWMTDDLLIVCSTASGQARKLAVQSKRSLQIGLSDEDFVESIEDAWRDFLNESLFSSEHDRLVIVTLRGTDSLLAHFGGLLEAARAARNGADFEHRLTTEGVLHAKVSEHYAVVRTILERVQKAPVELERLWRFLKALHVVSFDLNTSTSQTEAWIRSLLAQTATDHVAQEVAGATWNALLALAGRGQPLACRLRREDLPADLLARHAPLADKHQRTLAALQDHSTFILKKTSPSIGHVAEVSRDRLVAAVLAALGQSQLVLITGPSGVGKSALARAAIESIRRDRFAFAFRAEEFAKAHLDEVLSAAQIPVSGRALGAYLAGHDCKVLLVESAERLLESSTRGAFSDLLELAHEDPSWRLVLTCRDYSVDSVRSSLLERTGVGNTVIAIGGFDDAELDYVEGRCPLLARPLRDPALRRLLATPFYLDLAARMQWPEHDSLPKSEREFRGRVWRDVVRSEHMQAGGLPARRERVFLEIALRRARELTPYARCDDLDPAVVDLLRNDSLVSISPETTSLAAPAHDVLEDWATLRALEDAALIHRHDLAQISEVVATHPALRRAWRRFLEELLEREPTMAGSYFSQATRPSTLQPHFKDDTLVALLRSSRAPVLLTANAEALLADGCVLLQRILHLVRLTCVSPPTYWLPDHQSNASICYRPSGRAWASILRVIHGNAERVIGDEGLARSVVLAFLEDWSRSVSRDAPYPDGHVEAVAIVHHLLGSQSDECLDDDKRELKLLAKLPATDRDRFVGILRERVEEQPHPARRTRRTQRPTPRAEGLIEIVLDGHDGAAACRDVPEVVIQLASERWRLREPDPQDRQRYHTSEARDVRFGLDPWSTDQPFYPPSAFRGPFFELLRTNEVKGVDFILDLTAHSAEWYAHPRHPDPHCRTEPTEIQFSSGGVRIQQWSDWVLWCVYRGTSVVPYLLQCALMALERHLLAVGRDTPDQLDGKLLGILRRGRSVSTTAVVASVAVAHHRLAGETLVALLGSRPLVELDADRLMRESQALAPLSVLRTPAAAICEAERTATNKLAHRQVDLRAIALSLQVGPFAHRVEAVLDEHRRALGPIKSLSEMDTLWLAVLNDMDLRRRRVTPVGFSSNASVDGTRSASRAAFRLNPVPHEAEVQEVIDRRAAACEPLMSEMSLVVWGAAVFERQERSNTTPDEWRTHLGRAMAASSRPSLLSPGFWETGAMVAVVCVRDHWGALDTTQRGWCVEKICGAVLARRDARGNARSASIHLSGERAAGWVLAPLLGRPLTPQQRERVRSALAIALTHGIDEMALAACEGIRDGLWQADPALAAQSIAALTLQARSVQELLRAQRALPFRDREEHDDTERRPVPAIREAILSGAPLAPVAFDRRGWIGAHVLLRLLVAHETRVTEPAAHRLYTEGAELLAWSWRRRDDEQEESDEDDDVVRQQVVPKLWSLIARYALRAPVEIGSGLVAPCVAELCRYPESASMLFRYLTIAEDELRHPDQFWTIWQTFANALRVVRWDWPRLDPWSGERQLVDALFLAVGWDDQVKDWTSLHGREQRIQRLFEELPVSPTTVEAYLGHLWRVGFSTLPGAFSVLARRLSGRPVATLASRNSIYMLETLLAGQVYGRPAQLKQNADLCKTVLDLLDMLVELGSSAAFRMRDDFVTPMPTPVQPLRTGS